MKWRYKRQFIMPGGGTPIAETICRNILYFMEMTSDKLFYLFNQEENIINNM